MRKVAMMPALWKKHPNFFIVYFFTATLLHLGMGVTQILSDERYFNPSLVRVYDVFPIHVWGWASLLVFALMFVGAYTNFALWGRLGLGIGFFLCLARGLLIEVAAVSGAGIFVWGTIAAVHFTQLAEPQFNPITARE